MFYDTVKRLLDRLDPVTAHRLMMRNLEWFTTFGCHNKVTHMPDDDPVRIMGVRFPNPVGLAAGMDVNGDAVSSFGALGFGFVETGTVTVSPQSVPGKGSIRRLDENFSILHTRSFGNTGMHEALKRHKSADAFYLRGGVTGVNIGAGMETPPEGIADELSTLIEFFYRRADYFTLNLYSSHLKEACEVFRTPELLRSVLMRCIRTRDDCFERLSEEHEGIRRRPIVLKLLADLTTDEIRRTADMCEACGIDGLIACGPLATDPSASLALAFESGARLNDKSTEMIRLLSDHLKGRLPVIACGGILSADDAVCKIEAGASLVQLMSGFIFHGPAFIAQCVEAISRAKSKR